MKDSDMKKVRVGILGAAGYTGGELIRVLLNHPDVEIVFANSESNAGNKVYDVHEGLVGDTELEFTSEMPFDKVDVVFFCFGHGKSEAFLKEHEIPASVKIVDLAQDFRIKGDHDYVYGLPEIHREQIRHLHTARTAAYGQSRAAHARHRRERRHRQYRCGSEACCDDTFLLAHGQLLGV